MPRCVVASVSVPRAGERHQRGRRQRGAFGRIGAAADLVQQHQRRVVGVVQDPPQHAHVRAEGREARGDATAGRRCRRRSGGRPAAGCPRPTGGTMPLCASAAARPTALSSTVLPPVFGPLMSRVRSSGVSSRSNGTTGSRPGQQQRMAAVARSGARPARRPPRAPRRRPPPRSARGRRDRPPRRTSRPRPAATASSGRSRSVSSRSTRSVSRSSSTSASRSALPSSIASDGSMNSVPALPDLVVDDARRAGSASRAAPESRSVRRAPSPPRPTGAALASSPRSSASSLRSRRCRAACTSRRAAASAGLAVSSRSPSASTDCSSRRSMRLVGQRARERGGQRGARRPPGGDRRAPPGGDEHSLQRGQLARPRARCPRSGAGRARG